MTPTLWHYTCVHGRRTMGARTVLVPTGHLISIRRLEAIPPDLRPLLSLVWMTDLEAPDELALGLTRELTSCDRTAYRYRVTQRERARPWATERPLWDPAIVAGLETPGRQPDRWWVSPWPVRAVLDPP